MKTPATADVAVSDAAVGNAAGAGGAEFAPVEMRSAHEKLALAHQAMADKDYKRADDLANQAQADAKLAQSKADSAKAQRAANALQDDIRVLRDELNRANPKTQSAFLQAMEEHFVSVDGVPGSERRRRRKPHIARCSAGFGAPCFRHARPAQHHPDFSRIPHASRSSPANHRNYRSGYSLECHHQ